MWLNIENKEQEILPDVDKKSNLRIFGGFANPFIGGRLCTFFVFLHRVGNAAR